jgi:hypothetical protein
LEPGALPLLEFTLEQLYQRRGPNNQITLAAYQAIGGLEGAIGHVAEQAYASLSAAAQDSLPALLIALVSYPNFADDRLSLREADRTSVTATPAQQELVDALISRRLLTASAEVNAYGIHSTVRVAHESLLRQWARARDLIAVNREQLREMQLLEAEAADWVRNSRNDGYLVTGFRLARAAQLRSKFDYSLAPNLREFIEHSLQFDRRRIRRRNTLLTFNFIVLLSLAVTSFSWLALQRQRHQQAWDAANSLIPLAHLASGVQAAQAAPLVARALVIARQLAKANPNNRQAQDYLLQVTELCEAVKCVAPQD